jgi:hypothetical protein
MSSHHSNVIQSFLSHPVIIISFLCHFIIPMTFYYSNVIPSFLCHPIIPVILASSGVIPFFHSIVIGSFVDHPICTHTPHPTSFPFRSSLSHSSHSYVIQVVLKSFHHSYVIPAPSQVISTSFLEACLGLPQSLKKNRANES